MGVLGLSAKDFYSLSWREYVLFREGSKLKLSYSQEHTRMIVYTYASVHRDPNKPWPSIAEFWPLPTDGKKVDLKNTDEAKKLRKLLKDTQKMYNNG